jgi:hypothetical protein
MGRFQDSLVQYAKALAIDPNFLASHLGRAADFMYMGKAGEAASELDMITKKARSDGGRRTALFGRTVLAVDGGKWDEALAAVDKQYAIAEQAKDAAAMPETSKRRARFCSRWGSTTRPKPPSIRA